MRSLACWPAEHARVQPGRIALHYADEALSYAQFATAIASAAAFLNTELGLARGERVAYLGHNTPEQLILLFACARLGLVLVPLNWRLAPLELVEICENAAPSVLFVDGHCLSLVSTQLRAVCGRRLFTVRAGGAEWPSFTPAFVLNTAQIANSGELSDPVLISYTSGTTGQAKGAVLTQQALWFNALNAQHMHALTAADKVLTVLPLFHVGGLNIQTLPALLLGATVILLPRFEPAATLSAIAQHRPSLTVQVPTTLQALMADPDWQRADLSSLRAIATGSTDVPVELIEVYHARGVPVIQIYGATETAPVAIYQEIGEAFTTVGAIGRAGLHTEIRLVAEGDREADVGEPGEILVRGEHLAQGYWRNPQATAEAFQDGWFRSGDVAIRDRDGRYWFKDRIKNVIISGGENIYPAEIERVLRQSPWIEEAAVVGRNDVKWGQIPVLVVVPKDAGFDPAQLHEAFDGKLARYKQPREVLVLAALPRTALGKVQLQALRELIAAQA